MGKQREVICPKCHKPEKAGTNTRQEDIVMCSACTMRRVIGYENSLRKQSDLHPEQVEDIKPVKKQRIRKKKLKTCKKCNEHFTPMSNRQIFCTVCYKEARDKKNRENQKTQRIKKKKPLSTQLDN